MSTLYYLVGMPASGKSTWAKKNINDNTVWISSDNIRKELYGSESVQEGNIEVFELMFKRTRDALRNGLDIIYDATNINSKKRKGFINQFKNIRKVCIYFASDLKDVIHRNNSRDRKVPFEVINRMYKGLQIPMYHEGWDNIQIIRNVIIKCNKRVLNPKVDYLNLDTEGYKKVLRYIDSNNIDLAQDNSYHSFSVSRHMYYAYDYIKTITNDRNIIIATLLHDVGKAYCKNFKYEDSRYANFIGHENVSSQLVINYLFDCGFGNREIIDIATLVQLHMRFIGNEENAKSMDKLKDKIGIGLFNRLKLLHDADLQAK